MNSVARLVSTTSAYFCCASSFHKKRGVSLLSGWDRTRCRRTCASSRRSSILSRGACAALPKLSIAPARAISKSPLTRRASLKLGLTRNRLSTSLSAISRRLFLMACRLFASCASVLCESGAACAMLVSRPHSNEGIIIRGSMALLGALFLDQPVAAGFHHQQGLVARALQVAGAIGLAELHGRMIGVAEAHRRAADADLDGFRLADAFPARGFPGCPVFAVRQLEVGGIERQVLVHILGRPCGSPGVDGLQYFAAVARCGRTFSLLFGGGGPGCGRRGRF